MLLIASCVTDRDANALSESAADGRAFAQANCASCHALEDGVSPNPNAPSLRRAAKRLPDWAIEASFERGVQIGHSMEMPAFVFEDGDIANLLAYLETLKKRLSGGDRRVLTQPGRPVLRLRPVQMRGVLHSQQVARILRIDQQRRRGLRVIE